MPPVPRVAVDGAEHSFNDRIKEGVHFVGQNLADINARPFVIGSIVDGGFNGSLVVSNADRSGEWAYRVGSNRYYRGPGGPSPTRNDLRLWHLEGPFLDHSRKPSNEPPSSGDAPEFGLAGSLSKVLDDTEFLHDSRVSGSHMFIFDPVREFNSSSSLHPSPSQSTARN